MGIQRLYNRNGNIEKEYYYNENDQIHREDGPAIISYYENGNIRSEQYYINDKLYRENGRAVIRYHKNGSVENECYYNKQGQYHREDGPAVTYYYENSNSQKEYYYINGYNFDVDVDIDLNDIDYIDDINELKCIKAKLLFSKEEKYKELIDMIDSKIILNQLC